MSPLEFAAFELQLASIAGECDRHCAILQNDLLDGSRFDVRRREFFKKRDDMYWRKKISTIGA